MSLPSSPNRKASIGGANTSATKDRSDSKTSQKGEEGQGLNRRDSIQRNVQRSGSRSGSLQRSGSRVGRRDSNLQRPSTTTSSAVPPEDSNYCACYCSDRKLYSALLTEVEALKKVIAVKEKENERGIGYADILQLEIEKLRAIIDKQSKDMNRAQRYLFSKEASEKQLSSTITTMQSERKSAEILEQQNIEVFQRIKQVEAQVYTLKEREIQLKDELMQMTQSRDKLLEASVHVEATHLAQTKQHMLENKLAVQRALEAETTLVEFKEKVALREKEFLLRDELLMDKVSRSQQAAYKTLDLANAMTDRYYAAQDAMDASQEQVQIVHSRGALIISRLERERELLRSREIELVDEKNYLTMQLISLNNSREQTPSEFSKPVTLSRRNSTKSLSRTNSIQGIRSPSSPSSQDITTITTRNLNTAPQSSSSSSSSLSPESRKSSLLPITQERTHRKKSSTAPSPSTSSRRTSIDVKDQRKQSIQTRLDRIDQRKSSIGVEIWNNIPIRDATADIDGMDSIDFLDMILDSLSELDNLSHTSFDGEEQQDMISVGEDGVLKDTTFDLLDMILDEHHHDIIIEDHTMVEDHMVNGEANHVQQIVDKEGEKLVEHATTTTSTSVPFQSETTTSTLWIENSIVKMTGEALNHPPTSMVTSQELSMLQQGKRQLLSHFLCHLTDSVPVVDPDNDLLPSQEPLGTSEHPPQQPYIHGLPSLPSSSQRPSSDPGPNNSCINLSRILLNDDDVQYSLEWLRLLPLHKTKRIDLSHNSMTEIGLAYIIEWLDELAGNEFSRVALYSKTPLEIDLRHNKILSTKATTLFDSMRSKHMENETFPVMVMQEAEGVFVISYPDSTYQNRPESRETGVSDRDDLWTSSKRSFLTIKCDFRFNL